MSTWFATPEILWSLLAIPVAFALIVCAFFRRRQLTARLAAPLLLRKSVAVRPRVRRWKAFCVLMGVALLAIAAAGPQWGLDKSAQVRKGRDVVLVLDLSRSMSAEQPSRRELALRSLRQLADTFEEHGGNRVALVVFASQARLLFPFTHDCDHLRHTLAQIEARDIAKLSVPDPVSGTRIGAALKLAVESCDPTQSNHPIIVLLSDGDDPAKDDEWRQGIAAANERNLRVHVVGVGDPKKAETIPAGGDVLEYAGKPIRTKLEEAALREIASRTGGEYLPAHANALPLGVFVLHLLDADELRDETRADDALQVHQLRYAWFLIPALLFFGLAMLLSEGPPAMKIKPTQTPTRARAVSLALALAAIFSVSAADPPEAESLFRQATEAYDREEFDDAIKRYEQAERLTHDPGRVAFNKAAAYYRLGMHRDAIDSWRRCLEDDQAPAERRARAQFNLGNALVQYASEEPIPLGEAVASYRACLLHPNLPEQLRADARHNLAIAQMRWLDALKKQPEAKEPSKSQKPTYPENIDNDPKNGESVYVPVDPQNGPRVEKIVDANAAKDSKRLRAGSLMVLPDSAKVVPLSQDDTLATLESAARRIADARRGHRNPTGPAALSVKDW